MFLKNVIKRAKSVVDTTEEIDNHFFAEVMDEMEKGHIDKGLNGKAIAMSSGDEAKAKSLYIEMRAKYLQEKFNYTVKEKRQQEEEKRQQEEEKVKTIEQQEQMRESILTYLYDNYFFDKIFKKEIISSGYKMPWYTSNYKNNNEWYHRKIDLDGKSFSLLDKNKKVVLTFDITDHLKKRYQYISW